MNIFQSACICFANQNLVDCFSTTKLEYHCVVADMTVWLFSHYSSSYATSTNQFHFQVIQRLMRVRQQRPNTQVYFYTPVSVLCIWMNEMHALFKILGDHDISPFDLLVNFYRLFSWICTPLKSAIAFRSRISISFLLKQIGQYYDVHLL